MNNEKLLQKIQESLVSAKSSISASEKWVEKLTKSLGINPNTVGNNYPEESSTEFNGEANIIEGLFDGQNMVDGEGNIYPVPANYASKSKLIEGDKLKLTIAENGAFIFKQIELIPRVLKVGSLVMDGSQYKVLVDSDTYHVLYASVTFFRAHVGDQVTIIIPKDKPAKWAAVENIIPSGE